MPRIVPSQVVAIIDKYLPWAKDSSTKAQQRSQAAYGHAVYWLSGFFDLIEQIPDELLILKGEGSRF